MTPHQELAFRIVADTLHAELQRQLDPSLPQVPQLQLYVGGPGGTGKSYVIAALQALFKEWSREHWLLSTATTGLASFRIGGLTFDSASGLNKNTGDRVEDSSVRNIGQNTRLLLKCAKFFICDEVSMLSAAKLGHASRNFKKVRDSEEQHDLPLAGMHMLYFGDFFQLTPAGGQVSLYDGQKAAYSLRTAHQIGRDLWDNLTHVVFLHRNKRCDTDPQWVAMLERMRFGVGTDADFEMINTRLLSKTVRPLDKPDDPSVPRPLWVFGLDVQRTDYNIFSAIQQATRQRETILLCHARDEVMETPQTKKNRRRRARGGRRRPLGKLDSPNGIKALYMPENGTDYLPGVLPLITGMPVYLKKNLAVVLGVCNGSQGVLEKVILDEREPAVPEWADGDTAPKQHVLKYMPKALLVRFPECRLTTPLDAELSLDPKVVPLEAVTGGFEYQERYSIRRRQFPVLPGYARTLHSTQSETVKNLATDLNMGFPCANHAYVILSRPVNREAIVLLQAFKKELLQKPPTAELLLEQNRLEAIHDRTARDWFARIPGLLKDHQAHVRQRGEMLTAFFDMHGNTPAPMFEPPKPGVAKCKAQAPQTSEGRSYIQRLAASDSRLSAYSSVQSRRCSTSRETSCCSVVPQDHPPVVLRMPITVSEALTEGLQLHKWHKDRTRRLT